MSKTGVQNGLTKVTGSMPQAAVLGRLIENWMGGADDEAQSTEVGTLARIVRGVADDAGCAKAIHLLKDLESLGFIEFTGDFQPGPGSRIAVTGVKISLAVIQGDLFADEEEKTGKAPMHIKRPGRLMQTDDREETIGDVKWKGGLKLIRASDTNDEVVKALLGIWFWDEPTTSWQSKVLDKPFDGPSCVIDAWMWFENYIEFRPDLMPWINDNVTFGKPLELDEETFAAVVEMYREKKPDDSNRAIVCNTAVASGTLTIGDGTDRVQFRKSDSGLRWPTLPAKEEAPAEDAKPKRGRKAAK